MENAFLPRTFSLRLSLICVTFFCQMSAEIDWEEQWAIHAPHFKDGKAQVKLPTKNTFEILPGPGFGDFSHPTTRLMVDLMTFFVSEENVFDIGCGSGILSIAARKMGASKLFACDIDKEAIKHTMKNAAFNKLDINIETPPDSKPVVLMNMIYSEQKNAWKEHKLPFTTLITSGILTTEKKDYLTYAYNQGWQLMHEAILDGWLGYVFKEIA
ncbi:MAG: Ribosomal protein L11 methyltransferase [Chlamydiae bacterium]|nr:Ribosomal protein L11 methyltransferase [Chlamydiota bacterium]